MKNGVEYFIVSIMNKFKKGDLVRGILNKKIFIVAGESINYPASNTIRLVGRPDYGYYEDSYNLVSSSNEMSLILFGDENDEKILR